MDLTGAILIELEAAHLTQTELHLTRSETRYIIQMEHQLTGLGIQHLALTVRHARGLVIPLSATECCCVG